MNNQSNQNEFHDKFYFKACAFFRKDGKIAEEYWPLIQQKAEEMRSERALKIRKRDGNE